MYFTIHVRRSPQPLNNKTCNQQNITPPIATNNSPFPVGGITSTTALGTFTSNATYYLYMCKCPASITVRSRAGDRARGRADRQAATRIAPESQCALDADFVCRARKGTCRAEIEPDMDGRR